jgi:hypothetical protein
MSLRVSGEACLKRFYEPTRKRRRAPESIGRSLLETPRGPRPPHQPNALRRTPSLFPKSPTSATTKGPRGRCEHPRNSVTQRVPKPDRLQEAYACFARLQARLSSASFTERPANSKKLRITLPPPVRLRNLRILLRRDVHTAIWRIRVSPCDTAPTLWKTVSRGSGLRKRAMLHITEDLSRKSNLHFHPLRPAILVVMNNKWPDASKVSGFSLSPHL